MQGILRDFFKARLALARALYSSASILLLDDILSALDVHTSRWIVDKCLRVSNGLQFITLLTPSFGEVSSDVSFINTFELCFGG